MEKHNKQMSKDSLRPAFVYGTLMKGQRAEHLLAEAVYVGRCELKDYAMYNLGRYPGIQPCVGETVQMLDEYEEEGTLYDRKTVTVWMNGQAIDAQAYIYKKDVSGCPLMRRAWNSEV